MKLITSLCTGLLFFLPILYAQQIKRINSGMILEQASKLNDSSQYKKALQLYDQVDHNDTNYVKVLIAKALTCEADSQYARAITYCREVLSLKVQREYEPEIYNTYGNTLLDMRKYDSALKIYRLGLAKYPEYSFLSYNMGVVYLNMDSAVNAEQCFEKTLLMDPYMYSAHYELGVVALREGKLVQALLSFVACLLIEPSGKHEKQSIDFLDKIANSTDEILQFKNKRSVAPDEGFQEVEDIVLSKIALDKAYKVITEFDDPIFRQIQVVFEKLEYSDGSNDFWAQYYLPYFKQVFTSGKFELFVNHCFSDVNLPQIQQYNKKNKKELHAFVEDAASYFNLIRTTRELYYPKRQSVSLRYLYEEGTLAGKGMNSVDGKYTVGPWEFYYPPGNVKSTGQFNDAGERQGEWNFYYFSGKIKAKEKYENGKLQGEQQNYFENGVLSSDISYRDGQLDGHYAEYYYPGTQKSLAHYSLGKPDGEVKEYYANGALYVVKNFSNGVQQGFVKTYYKSGQLKEQEPFENGKSSGLYTSYYEDGTMSEEGQFKNGRAEGEWKFYFSDGNLKEKSNIVNDSRDGISEEYFDNGKPDRTLVYKKGKLNGESVYYDRDGILYSKSVCENGKILSVSFFNKSGKQISSSVFANDRIDVVNYTPGGLMESHRVFNKNGNLEGPDSLFYPSGKVSQISFYRDGAQSGPAMTFYLNGQKKFEGVYTDGQEDGYHRSYYANGNLESEGWVSAGQTEGQWNYYDQQGKLSSKAYYLDGDLSGFREEYMPDGRLYTVEKYVGGWLEELMQYDSTGAVLIEDSFPRGTGKFVLLYPNRQKMVDGNYVQGDLDGPYTEYFYDGTLQSTVFYEKGLKDSVYNAFNYGGSKNTEGAFKYGKKYGLWKSYSESGVLLNAAEYVDDQMNGTKIYYFPGGSTDLEVTLKDDQRNGLGKKYDSQGSLAYQVIYQEDDPLAYSYLGADGKPVAYISIPPDKGEIKSYFSNGKLSRECQYRDGKLHGPDILYFMNGRIRSVDTCVYGIYQGNWREYYEDGTMKLLYNYRDDELEGVCREFYQNGRVKKEMNFVNGNYEGPSKYYDENGKLTQTRIYYFGNLIAVNNEK